LGGGAEEKDIEHEKSSEEEGGPREAEFSDKTKALFSSERPTFGRRKTGGESNGTGR